MAAAAGVLPPLVTVGVTWRQTYALHEFRVRQVELDVPRLPADLDGLRIAHVSDLHIGQFLPEGTAARVAEAVNALAADLVAFTGDLLDISCPQAVPGIDFIRRLDPRQGLAMVQGNHDGMADADRFEQPVREAGLPLLQDQAMTCRVPGRSTPVQLLGLSWGELKFGSEVGRSGRDARRRFRIRDEEATTRSLARLSSLRQPGAFPILLAHHPHAFDGTPDHGFPLTLAGHTHGGQLMLTERIGVGPVRFRYWSGVYRKGDARLFVNNGVGSWFPLRINAPAEIVLLTLRGGGLATAG